METRINTKPNLTVIKEDSIPHILEPGEVGAVLELTVKDKDGKITEHRVMKSKSFVRQFLELLWIQAGQINENLLYELRDTSNVLENVAAIVRILAANALAGDATFGIVVGTGAVAPTINDYALGTLIPHGIGVGPPVQLQYSAVVFAVPVSDATTSQFTITRDFANGSGVAAIVNEIGLYVKGYRYDTNYYFLAIRDVIAGGISVPNGQTLTVNYRIQAVV